MTSFSVVLVEPKFEGNIGSVARLMKNFGLEELILINPLKHPKFSGEARAMSMHGLDVLENAVVLSDYRELIDRFDFLVGTTAVSGGDSNSRRRPVFPEHLVNCLDCEGKVALIFGREDSGMSNEEIDVCDVLVTIPASREYPTMNLSHSVAVILYELTKHRYVRELSSKKKFREIGGLERKIMLEKFGEMVDLILQYEYERNIAKKTFRNIVGRAFISQKESFTLTGIFRKASVWIEKGKKACGGDEITGKKK